MEVSKRRASALLVAEILDRLEVQQAVDRLGVGVGVAVVHLAADGDAPLARGEREPHVDGDGREHDRT